MVDYYAFVAEQLDSGKKNTEILKQLIELDEAGQIEIPPKSYVYIDRYRISNQMTSNVDQTRILNREINKHDYPFFLDEPAPKQIMRRILKHKNLTSFETIEHGKLETSIDGTKVPDAYTSSWLEQWRWDRKMGEDLMLFESQTGTWRETQYQHIERYLSYHREQETKPNFALLRLYAHRLTNLDNNLMDNVVIPWRYLVSDKISSGLSATIAIRALGVFLDRSVEESVTAIEVRKIETMSQWIKTDPSLKWLWAIESLARGAVGESKSKKAQAWISVFSGTGNELINWNRLEAAVHFIRHNIDTSPDIELLSDWMCAEVNIDGVGKIRSMADETWDKANIFALFPSLERDVA